MKLQVELLNYVLFVGIIPIYSSARYINFLGFSVVLASLILELPTHWLFQKQRVKNYHHMSVGLTHMKMLVMLLTYVFI